MLIHAPIVAFNEIFQQNKIKFSWCIPQGKDYKELHSPVLCRDFLGDAIHSFLIKYDINIYDFKWNHKVDPSIKDPHLVIYLNKKEQDLFTKNLKYLHKLEQQNKLKKTKIVFISDNYIIINFSKQWLKKNWALSYFTYSLKCNALVTNMDELTGNELEYWNRSKHILVKLIFNKNLKKLLNTKGTFSGYPDGTDIGEIHNCSGFVSCTTNNFAPYYKEFNAL